MRRLRILFYWFFYAKNNVSFVELLRFLAKPVVSRIGGRYIEEVRKGDDFHQIRFTSVSRPMFWPASFPMAGLSQVSAETFDEADWHYYRKPQTPIEKGDILLDVGTAEGLFPLVVLDQCEKLFLVEPSAAFGEALAKTFQGAEDKVTLFRSAVGNTDGEVYFDENSLEGHVSTTGSRIPIHKIDTLIPAEQKITFLKADIEGFELDMLKGAAATIRRNKPKIAITSYHPQNNAAEMIALVKSYVPEYNTFVKGIHGEEPKPVMIHFWI